LNESRDLFRGTEPLGDEKLSGDANGEGEVVEILFEMTQERLESLVVELLLRPLTFAVSLAHLSLQERPSYFF